MQGYVMGLFGLAICCAVVELFTPEGEGGGIARHIKWMSGICLLVVLWTPLSTLFHSGETVPDRLTDALENWLNEGEASREEFDQIWQGEQERLDLVYASETIKQLIAEQFDLSLGDITVQVQTDETGQRLSLVRIGLSGRAIWIDTHKVQSFIEETIRCESTIYLE